MKHWNNIAKSLLFTLALALGLALIGTSPALATDTSDSGDVIKISSADELRQIGIDDNYPMDGYYILTADIDLEGSADNQWMPIGNYSNWFSGTFDGDNHTIKGLYINDSSAGNQGLFGIVGSGGKIENLTVSGTVTANSYVGGVVGYNNGGTVIDCTNSVNITATASGAYIGGVVGYNSTSGSVTNCTNNATVTGTGFTPRVGGVVGYNNGGTVTNCTNSGNVTDTAQANAPLVGGVVGSNSGSNSTVENCTNSGTVTAKGSSPSVGGVVGSNNNGSVKNCYNTGNVSTTGSAGSAGSVVGNNSGSVTGCYFLESTANSGIGGGSGSGSAKSLSEDKFANSNNFEGWDFDTTWTISSLLGRPVLQSNPEGGDGTSENPYEIDTAEKLQTFATIVNGTDNLSPDTDACAILTADINLSGVCSQNLGSWTPIGTDSSHPFTGSFNGDSHTISGLYINNNSYTANYQGLFGRVGSDGTVKNLTVSGEVIGGYYVGGVVGYNDGGNITDCTNSGKVTAVFHVGGVVGDNNGGTVANCTNRGTVTATGDVVAYVGGVVGNNDSKVTNCHNTGNVTATDDNSYAGGVVGNNFSGTITNCTNSATVKGTGGSSNVGGVAGYSGDTITNCYNTGDVSTTGGGNSYAGGVVGLINYGGISNCYNTGDVSATGGGNSNAGGVVGYNISGSIINCYNTGNVTGNGNVGGVVGSNYGSSTVENCYYLADEESDSIAGTTAKTDDQFRSGKVAWLLQNEQDDNDGLVWGQTIGLDEYPVLTSDASKVVYQVTFISDGSAIDTAYVNSGGKVSAPKNPTQEGYTFAGWYSDSSLTTLWDFDTVITDNITLYAKWTEIEPEQPSEPSTPSRPTTPSEPEEPSGPSTGDSEGWDDIRDEIAGAEDGGTITIDMNGETEVPAGIFEAVAGKDVTIEFDLGDGVTWEVKGTDIPTDARFSDLDLGVSMNTSGIPVNVINAITGEVSTVQITLAHDGDFGFVLTLTAPLCEENAGYWANLYHYDEDAKQLNFETAAEIADDGTVKLRLTHASQYAIVIDDHSHAPIKTTPVSDLFTDLDPDAWYIDAVQYVYDQGLMTGTSATTFEPNTSTTRGMIVSILYRLEGNPDISDENLGYPFADVDASAWYADPVYWARMNGIVAGFEDGTFRPNDAITREQLAAILYNYAKWKGMDVSARTSLDAYTDQPSEWATDVMQWAVVEGLISGTSTTTLDPQGNATRAQVAAILQRFLEN